MDGPSRSKNLSTLLTEALSEPVTVVENGRRRTIDKCRAIVIQLVNRSAKRDLKATQIVLAMSHSFEDRADRSTELELLTKADLQVIAGITPWRGGEKE
jgi:hypothetical protein